MVILLREIDEQAVAASKNPELFNKFAAEKEFFILKTASKDLGKYITKSDDEWSIALSAFSQAIKDYSFSKGSFLSFAELVIKRRMIDYLRNRSKNDSEILVDPFIFSSESDEDDEANTIIKSEVSKKISISPDDTLKNEIMAITDVLLQYGFSFYDLTSCSPKAEKTKLACAKAVRFISENPLLYKEMQASKTLPLKEIEKNTKLPRKILERHRKYIIAAVEIITGDYPYLAEYMRFVRKEIG